MMRRISFCEEFFEYDADEYRKWCLGDEATIRGLIERCGLLGRGESTYFLQAMQSQNYPEVRYAIHLVENLGFPQEGLFYENFYLSERVFASKMSSRSKGKKMLGTQYLRRLLSPRFFEEFDRLFDLNAVGKTIDGVNIDLCAVDPLQRRVGFFEVKKYSPGKATTEIVSRHQLFVLAFVRHILETCPSEIFVGGPCKIDAKLIAFVPAPGVGGRWAKPISYDFDLEF